MTYSIKSFFNKLKRTIQFIPIIWKGYDFDYRSAVDLFEYQLSRTAKFLESDNAYSSESKQNAKRLKMILRLLDKVYNEDYVFEYTDQLRQEYGIMQMEWHPNADTTYTLKGFKWSKAVDDAHNESINKVYKILLEKGMRKQERAHQLLWKLIEHNIRKFWD